MARTATLGGGDRSYASAAFIQSAGDGAASRVDGNMVKPDGPISPEVRFSGAWSRRDGLHHIHLRDPGHVRWGIWPRRFSRAGLAGLRRNRLSRRTWWQDAISRGFRHSKATRRIHGSITWHRTLIRMCWAQVMARQEGPPDPGSCSVWRTALSGIDYRVEPMCSSSTGERIFARSLIPAAWSAPVGPEPFGTRVTRPDRTAIRWNHRV